MWRKDAKRIISICKVIITSSIASNFFYTNAFQYIVLLSLYFINKILKYDGLMALLSDHPCEKDLMIFNDTILPFLSKFIFGFLGTHSPTCVHFFGRGIVGRVDNPLSKWSHHFRFLSLYQYLRIQSSLLYHPKEKEKREWKNL